MSKDFDIKLLVKDELKKNLIFGLHARPPIGIILGFCGYSHHVMPLIQTLSHTTRAYIINADGLPGFISIKRTKLSQLYKVKGRLGKFNVTKKLGTHLNATTRLAHDD